jgi:hypothetical protein
MIEDMTIRKFAARGIQYAVPSARITNACVHWIIRFRG